MLLTPGTRLGPYEIETPLGHGGMGEVYRARDTRLHRRVAIKIIAAAAGGAEEFRERFQREARAISSMTHAHICALYDVGQHDGLDFLVLEYLEGETLARRLEEGTLPPDLVMRCAVEIAEALDKAHRHGIVHRDLKPANIMITKAGVKLMDFGLAKLRRNDSGSLGDTLTTPEQLTSAGTILGTLQYMAPEQLEGREADARADIFAFGSLVYEMATGRRAFEGKSQASLIAAILRSEPPAMASLQPLTPAGLDRVVQKCLAKDPDERWQHAHDLLTALTWIAESEPVPRSAVERWSSRSRPLMWGVIGLVGGAVASGLVVRNLREVPEPDTSPSRWTITLPPTQSSVFSPALSPDGRRLVYSADDSGRRMLFVRSFDQVEAVPLRGTDGASRPFFSPDGLWVGFFAAGQLFKAAAAGGTPVKLCDAPLSDGADWGVDDRIVFGSPQGLQRVSAAGGKAEIIIAAEGAASLGRPQILPDGRHVLFIVSGKDPTDERIVVQPLGGGERRALVERGSYARYAAGHLLYSSGPTLLARAFDIERLELIGPSMLVADDISAGAATFVVSGKDVLIYLARSEQLQQGRLVWVDRRGALAPLSLQPGVFRGPRLSPDGRTLLVEVMAVDASGQSIWTAAVDRATSFRRLTLDPAFAGEWTRDGTSVTFSSRPLANLFRQAVDGSRAERLTTSEVNEWPGSWTRDGELVFVHVDPTTASDIWMLSRDGARTAVLQKPGTQWGARLSPDGRWLAYGSDESGAWEVYVTSFPAPSGQWRISTDGGQEVLWSKDGSEVFYRKGARMMSVSIQQGETFQYSAPTEVFSNPSLILEPGSPGWPNYDVAADGRFLMLQRHGDPKLQFNVALNWTRALERRAAAGQ